MSKKDKKIDNKSYENGFEDVVNQIVKNKRFAKAPINNPISNIYNTRNYLLTLDVNILTNSFATDGLYKTMIKQPVYDAFKNYTIKTTKLKMEQIKRLEQEIEDKEINQVIKEALFWNRLYGGSAIIIEQANIEPDQPFDLNSVSPRDVINFYTVNRWQLANNINREKKINITNSANIDSEHFFYQDVAVDRSRLIVLKGEEAPYYLKNQLNGWGLSVCETLLTPKNLYNKTMNLLYEIIDESKIDIYKVDGLKNSIISGQEKAVINKIQLTNLLKNFQNALVLDSNDGFEQKQLSNLQSITNILQEIKYDICSSLKIPAVILWGVSPSGFSSGEFDLKQYQDSIKQSIQPEIKRILVKILKILIKNLFNLVVDDIDIEFDPFIIQTRKEKEETNEIVFDRLKRLYDDNLLTKKEFFEALEQNDILTLKVQSAQDNSFKDTYQQEFFDKADVKDNIDI